MYLISVFNQLISYFSTYIIFSFEKVGPPPPTGKGCQDLQSLVIPCEVCLFHFLLGVSVLLQYGEEQRKKEKYRVTKQTEPSTELRPLDLKCYFIFLAL